jgi:glucose 1-dehydrogenase
LARPSCRAGGAGRLRRDRLRVSSGRDEELEKRIVALGDRTIGVDADVNKVADLQRLVDATVKAFGRLDIMVNNAGTRPAPVLDTTEQQYDAVLRST